METYITVSFWLGVIGVFFGICMACFAEYPIVKTQKIGEVVFKIITQLVFVVWAGILLFLQ